MERRKVVFILLMCLCTMYSWAQEFPNVGTTISLTSLDSKDKYVSHKNYDIILSEITSDLDKKDASFKIVKALNGKEGYISLESSSFPKHYVRNLNFIMRLQKVDPEQDIALFNNDASFKIINGLAKSGISFESYNFPHFYIRTSNNVLRLEMKDGSKLFKSEATFISEEALSNK